MTYRVTPCDLKFFKLHQCIADNNFVEWKQYHYHYHVGDIVFIYTSAPESRISYMMEVESVDIPLCDGFDDSGYEVGEKVKTKYQGYKNYEGNLVRFKFLKRLNSPNLKLHHLLEHGLKLAPLGPKYLRGELLQYILDNLE